MDFVIPKGEVGPTGPAGPTLLRSAYLVTFNDKDLEDGVSVLSGANLPITRKELDVSNLLELDTVNNLIKFNVEGYYKISFSISAYPAVNGVDFDPTTDIVSVGFKEKNTDHVYVGVGEWVFNGEAIQLSASGIIAVVDTAVAYELSNLSKETIYLNTPKLANISSASYFSNPLVTIVIEYLGG